MGTIIVFGLIVLVAATVVIILRGNSSEQAEEQMNETFAAESQAQAKTVNVKVKINSNTFEKAEKLYEAGFYDECANNVRKICERHVDDMLYIKGIRVTTADGSLPTLKDKIDTIEANLRLPEKYIAILNYIRVVGNKGSHEQNSVTREEAERTLYYMKTILEGISPVMQAAQPNAAYQPAANNYSSVDNGKTIKVALYIMLLLLIPGGLLCFGGIFISIITQSDFAVNVFPVGFAMCFIGALISIYIRYLLKVEDCGSKTGAIISMLTDDRISYNNSQRLQQEQMRQHMDWVQQEQIRQHNEWAMNETMKAGTPMSMGGYMPDNSFNNFNNGF